MGKEEEDDLEHLGENMLKKIIILLNYNKSGLKLLTKF